MWGSTADLMMSCCGDLMIELSIWRCRDLLIDRAI